MDFFVEAGVLFGHCDENDKHHKECAKFFWGKYSIPRFTYFISVHSVRDFQTLRIKKIRDGGYSNKTYEEIEICMVRLLYFIKEVAYENQNPQKFKKLAECLTNDCGCHPPDHNILSDALFWSLRQDKEKTPIFVTVDGTTIKNKRDSIYERAKTFFGQMIPLQIKGVWEL